MIRPGMTRSGIRAGDFAERGGFEARLRAALVRGSAPVVLAWNERHRHRFLTEFHEMKAWAAGELFRLDGALVWFGRLASSAGEVEWAIRYDERHPGVEPAVFVLAPDGVAQAMARGRDGRVRVLSEGDWHPGLTAFDLWRMLRRQLSML